MIRGYARVSTQDQDLAAQYEALKAAGAIAIYQEKQSGAKRDRVELQRLLDNIRPGETLMVTRLDRLARSTLDLLTILDTINKRGAQFKSLADSWADTTTPHGRLMLTVLGGLAEFERTLIIARTGEGIRRARAAGVKFGRKHKLKPEQQIRLIDDLCADEKVEYLAVKYNVSPRMVYRIKKEMKESRDAV